MASSKCFLKNCTSLGIITRTHLSVHQRHHTTFLCSAKTCSWGIGARHYASRVIVREPLSRILLRELRHRFSKPKMKTPPYDHVCQVGDPILRGQSSPVDPRQIKSAEIQNVIRMMTKVMRRAGAVGCAAPQVGVAKQIVVMELTEKHLERFEPEVLKAREVALFPLTVFINPHMKVTDPRVVTLLEGCLSISGYDACVPRYYGVELTGDDHSEFAPIE
ncbi:peptide deformylase, mitochondrial-like isoform X2 [Acanthaster planci]|uniref:Peptide deformylase n=1 Tax=Acanthaster planci TaxID=133434 RepID=A0A8B7ZJF8_ACAPL|nr:peptide deformylase, mitochondrial-like isoform X2 [Acanthaster planci]